MSGLKLLLSPVHKILVYFFIKKVRSLSSAGTTPGIYCEPNCVLLTPVCIWSIFCHNKINNNKEVCNPPDTDDLIYSMVEMGGELGGIQYFQQALRKGCFDGLVSESHLVHLPLWMRPFLSTYDGQWELSCPLVIVSESLLVHLWWSVRTVLSTCDGQVRPIAVSSHHLPLWVL